MAISVAKGFRDRILMDPAWVVVHVRADPDAAAEALRRATPDLRFPDDGSVEAPGIFLAEVFPVSYTPGGAVVIVAGKAVPDQMLTSIPEVVARHLTAVGVEAAVIGEPALQHGPLNTVSHGYWTRAVRAHLIADPPNMTTPAPSRWVELASAWVRAGLSDDHLLWASAGSQFSVAPADLPAMLGQARRRRADCFLLAGQPPSWPSGDGYPPAGWTWEQIQTDAAERLGGRFRAVWVSFGTESHETQMVLSGGGPETTDDELDVLARDLTTAAKDAAAGLAYGYVDIGAHFGAPGVGSLGQKWTASAGNAGYHITRACDEVVFDAYLYQVLSGGHLRRLGREPPRAEALDGGRVGLAIGEPDDWLPARSSQDVRQRGWDLLRPCLLQGEDPIPVRPLHPTHFPGDAD